MSISKLYRDSLVLLADLYQLTMAYGYWKLGVDDREAAFNLFFRKHPFGGGFTLAAGLNYVVDFLQGVRFGDCDIEFPATIAGSDGKPLFEPAFLDYLRAMEYACDVDAVPEGAVVFRHEPLVRVTGPILQCRLFEARC